jgi:hypothetical protein
MTRGETIPTNNNQMDHLMQCWGLCSAEGSSTEVLHCHFLHPHIDSIFECSFIHDEQSLQALETAPKMKFQRPSPLETFCLLRDGSAGDLGKGINRFLFAIGILKE